MLGWIHYVKLKSHLCSLGGRSLPQGNENTQHLWGVGWWPPGAGSRNPARAPGMLVSGEAEAVCHYLDVRGGADMA